LPNDADSNGVVSTVIDEQEMLGGEQGGIFSQNGAETSSGGAVAPPAQADKGGVESHRDLGGAAVEGDPILLGSSTAYAPDTAGSAVSRQGTLSGARGNATEAAPSAASTGAMGSSADVPAAATGSSTTTSDAAASADLQRPKTRSQSGI
jgi:hypothetical protein